MSVFCGFSIARRVGLRTCHLIACRLSGLCRLAKMQVIGSALCRPCSRRGCGLTVSIAFAFSRCGFSTSPEIARVRVLETRRPISSLSFGRRGTAHISALTPCMFGLAWMRGQPERAGNDGPDFESYWAASAAVSQDREDDSASRASANASITSRPPASTNTGSISACSRGRSLLLGFLHLFKVGGGLLQEIDLGVLLCNFRICLLKLTTQTGFADPPTWGTSHTQQLSTPA